MAGENKKPIGLNRRGTCPHCGVAVELTALIAGLPIGKYNDAATGRQTTVTNGMCPACNRTIIVAHEQAARLLNNMWHAGELLATRYIWPTIIQPRNVPEEVPDAIRQDYVEAAAVLGVSEKASAALSRRCLQLLLREAAGTKTKDLADQIVEVLPTLPGYLQPQLDAVRNIGNFAAHAQKSKSTGEIVDVEPGEAEWTLDVLDLLFDFYYVQAKIAKEKREALNKKLADMGKPAMK